MESIISFFPLLQKAFFATGPFFLLLGVLIFIHELGHFLVARYFDVKVQVFSLGFGPKILKYKRGDTIYCLSLFPLGGYVKMSGDNPLEDIPDSEKTNGFLYQKVYKKWLIAFGGPFMNLIFSVLAFLILALVGLPSYLSQLGDIPVDSTAYKAGFRSGDKVLFINGQAVSYYKELNKIIKNKADEKLFFKVQAQTNEIKTLSATTNLIENPNPLERKKFIGAIEGLSLHSIGLRVGIVYNSPAYKAGFRTFDEITKVNGKDFRYWRDLKSFIENTNNSSLSFIIKRDSESKNFIIKRSFSSLVTLGIEPANLYIDRVGPDTPAQQAGLMRGDRLISIDEKPIKNWKQVLTSISSYSGKPFSIVYKRKDKQKTSSLSPKSLFVEGNVKKRFMLGIVSGGLNVLPEPILKKQSPFQAFVYSGKETWKWMGFITTSLIRLIQGEISLRTMGGPIVIGRVAHNSFHQGFQEFLFIMSLISLNLFFLNLLPIPALDGGYLLFFTLEGILGRPLSVKKLVVAQQAGLLALISLMGLTFFNDIYNWLKAW